MPEHRVATQERWQAERDALLAQENELTRLSDELAQRRRQLPWVAVEEEHSYHFHRDLGFAQTEADLAPLLEGEIPPTVEQYARVCGTDAAGYVAEGPGLSAYAMSDGIVYRTYVTTARGVEPVMAYYGLLDRTAMGRDETGSQPQWVRWHDEY